MVSPIDMLRRQMTTVTDRLYSMPVLVLMPHSRCNCRCVMCDIWRANRAGTELSPEDLAPHLEDLRQLNVRRVVLSGGEALMHSNLWTLCEAIEDLGAKVTLLSTGLLLRRHAEAVVRWCDEVVVSLDGSRDIHDSIRNIPRAYERLADGVAALKEIDPVFRVRGRCVLQRLNYHDLQGIIDAAHELGLDEISFLAADVSTEAFNRPEPWSGDRVAEVALSPDEAASFAAIVEDVIADYRHEFDSGFIAESPDKLRRLPAYFAALNGEGVFPEVECNAPWVSTVVEADGTVRPCFFHDPIGNIRERPLGEILNGDGAVRFRRNLDVRTNPVCRKCVCTLRLRPHQQA